MDDLKQKSLDYHINPTPGKLNITSSKPVEGQEDLSLAYSPGVAYPCLEIAEDKDKVYDYTSLGNTVAVITDGSAVLGLGDIGAHASMPVMEGKCVLLKSFADINGIPISIKEYKDNDAFVDMCAAMDTSFGAINLEDIKAPRCFEIEEKLIEKSDIPVFHDDQHGTAIISTAGIINSLEIIGKKIEDVKILVNGAGAAGIACAKMYVVAGAKKENIYMLDSRGLIYKGRTDGMNPYKELFANGDSEANLSEVIKDADIFVGLSVADLLTEDMVKSMADDPIIFGLANPNPEIKPDLAKQYGVKVIATGRSDHPNQVNNVLGFPGIFRGALDTRASVINEEMKMAAVKALIEITKEEVPADIKSDLAKTYPKDAEAGMFDPENPLSTEYIIPKPFDKRVVPKVARYVAEAAMVTGVAKVLIEDLDGYEELVRGRI